MRILVAGACGFVGSRLAQELAERFIGVELVGIDNLVRRGSESNVSRLRQLGGSFVHADVRSREDLAELPPVDWIIDCAANPSVLAGIAGGTSQLVSHNLVGTLNLLEKCRRDGAGLVILSTSRVYNIDQLNAIPRKEAATRFVIDEAESMPAGCSKRGVAEDFSTSAPISLYGATKLASEIMALEYGAAFQFPVWINRCGVLAGAGQFGRIDQGVFSFWIYRWLLGLPLRYVGYGGRGLQVRDLLAPGDLASLLEKQLRNPTASGPRVVNVGGGLARSMSLLELSDFCFQHVGKPGPVLGSEPSTRRYDMPIYVTDTALAERIWSWRPEERLEDTLEGIVRWGRANRALVEGLMAL